MGVPIIRIMVIWDLDWSNPYSEIPKNGPRSYKLGFQRALPRMGMGIQIRRVGAS